MRPFAERRLLQIAAGLACIVPLWTGGTGMIEGPAMLREVSGPQPIDLESHYRYLSGLLFGLGLAFAWCIPAIERRGTVFRALAAVTVVGGLGRLVSLVQEGTPGGGHLFGLVMELGAVPLLVIWQWRVERRSATPPTS